jgi:phosphoserine phosphatase
MLKREIRLAVFDLDGTLTPVDSLWKYLHDEFGTWEHGRVAAQKYKRGEISYKEWAETDAGYWSGASLSRIAGALERIPYRPGAREVFRTLREKCVKTAIISAGLSILADKAAKELGADMALSNELETNDGRLTGGIKVNVAVNDKAGLVREIAEENSIPLSQVALIGDRAFDLSPDDCLKIAFKPKDEIARQRADHIVEDDDLSRLLQYLV